jgi:hypothetical protein
MSDENTAYLMNELKSLHPEDRIILSACAEEFPDYMKQAFRDPVIASKLNVAMLRLDVESTSDLWLPLNLKHMQGQGLARAPNEIIATW